jgi:hypothetical protein
MENNLLSTSSFPVLVQNEWANWLRPQDLSVVSPYEVHVTTGPGTISIQYDPRSGQVTVHVLGESGIEHLFNYAQRGGQSLPRYPLLQTGMWTPEDVRVVLKHYAVALSRLGFLN